MENKSQLIGILPCAGLGARACHFTKAKELTVLEGKPNLQHWIETLFSPLAMNKINTLIILSSLEDTHEYKNREFVELLNSLGFNQLLVDGSYTRIVPNYYHNFGKLFCFRFIGNRGTEYEGKEIAITFHKDKKPHPNPIDTIDTVISTLYPKNLYDDVHPLKRPVFFIAFPDIYLPYQARHRLSREIGFFSSYDTRNNYVSIFSKHKAKSFEIPVDMNNYGHVVLDADENVVELLARYSTVQMPNGDIVEKPRAKFPENAYLELGIYIVPLHTLYCQGEWLYNRMLNSGLNLRKLEIQGEYFWDLGDPKFYSHINCRKMHNGQA